MTTFPQYGFTLDKLLVLWWGERRRLYAQSRAFPEACIGRFVKAG